MQELISIIMTSYNYARFLPEAIESILNQTYTNWELLIIDDASKDNSIEIIKKYQQKDSRIKLIENKRNLGLAKSLQLAIRHSQNKWLAFLESDDILEKNSLEKRIKLINQNPTIDLIFSDVSLFGEEKNIQNLNKHFKFIKEKYNILQKDGFINNFEQIINDVNIIPTFSVVMTKKELLENCDYKTPIPQIIDLYLWNQLHDKNIYYTTQKLTKWRLHSSSYINSSTDIWLKKVEFKIKTYLLKNKNKNFLKKIVTILIIIRKGIIAFSFKSNKFKILFLYNPIFEKKF